VQQLHGDLWTLPEHLDESFVLPRWHDRTLSTASDSNDGNRPRRSWLQYSD
jgi:hypothetical protein